jgi:ABC-type dipeptide/oligopeptide/nickel transport system permease component
VDRTTFLLHRLVQTVFVMVGIVLATFVLIRLIPGDPAVVMLGRHATPEGVAAVHAQLGLDQPVPVQLALYARSVLTGNLGTSIVSGDSVVAIVLDRVQVTIFLILYSAILATVIAVPLAAVAAVRRGMLIDRAIRATFTLTMAMPNFWVGIILILLLSLTLRLFPVSGYGESLPDHLWHLFLPSLTTALYLSSLMIRSLRNSILDVIDADHVAFARAKGLTEGQVFVRHVLRNGLSSTITVLGITVGWLVGSTVVIETVFSVPGAGRLLIDSVFRRDYPVIQGLVLLFGFLVVFINLLVDLTHSLLDPRVRL